MSGASSRPAIHNSTAVPVIARFIVGQGASRAYTLPSINGRLELEDGHIYRPERK